MLERIKYYFSDTSELRRELSDIMQAEAAVAEKSHVPKREFYGGAFLGQALYGDMSYGGAINSALSEPERFFVRLTGRDVSFRVDSQELFQNLKTGQTVQVQYRSAMLAIYNYVPPNFKEKVLVERKSAGIVFVGVI